MLQVQSPFQQFFASDGSPLSNGSIYIGSSAQNPETNPIAIYWDEAKTQPAAQPVKTYNGYVVRNGTPSQLYVSSDNYSITVRDNRDRIVYTALNANSLSNLQTTLATSAGASMIGASGGTWTTVQGFITTLATSVGAALVGFLQNGVGAVMRTVQNKLSDRVCVFDFMTQTKIDGVKARSKLIDVTAELNAAIASLGAGGGVVWLPKGLYRTTSKVTVPANVTLVGDGMFGGFGAYDQGCTTIFGDQGGDAILSLVGSVACQIQDLCIQSGPPGGTYPQTGLMLGRTGTASCGYHQIKRVSVYGSYGIAAIFSIASEDNYWEDLNVWLYGGTAKWCFYSSIGNSFPAITTPLYTSSNLTNTFNKFWFTNGGGLSDSACLKLDMAEGMAAWSFYGGYFTASSGSYVEIGNGYIDGLSSIGALTFVGCNGERLAGGDPIYGYKLTASVACTLPNLTITGGRFDFSAGSNHYLLWQSNNLSLTQPNITLKPPEAFPYAQTVLYRNKILGGTINLDRYAAWKAATLSAGWTTAFGAPYPAPSFMIDSTGRVHLRGTVQGGTGVIMNLPDGYRPAYTWRIPTQSNGAAALLSIAATGDVTLLAGSATNLELGNLSFDMTEWVI